MENKSKSKPYVSVIVPCLNEEKFIAKCLDSIINQDYPSGNYEILVLDGMSTDNTRNIILQYTHKYPFIRLINNEKRIIPAAMNLGIKEARGSVIIKMDAHSVYPPDYISKCVDALFRYGADNVGGVWHINPSDNTITSKAIVKVLTHRFGSGNAYVKVGLNKVKEVDTVAFGCFKKDIFEKIGLFNENLAGGSDMEFNKRIKKHGGKIILVPSIFANYFCDSTFKKFWNHNFSDGVWISYPLKYGVVAFSIRHLIPFFFVSTLISLLILSFFFSFFRYLLLALVLIYLLITFCIALSIAIKEKNANLFFYLVWGFILRHFGYGLGTLWGFITIIIPPLRWHGRRSRKL